MVKNLGKKLFGVAPAEAMSMIIVAEERFFLEDQRMIALTVRIDGTLSGGDRLLHHVGYELWPLERYTEHGRWPSCVREQLLGLPKLYLVKIWMFKQQFRPTALQMLCNL